MLELKINGTRYAVAADAERALLGVLRDNLGLTPSAGAGETPITTVAPALGNAICAASGIRVRALPMLPAGVLSLDATA